MAVFLGARGDVEAGVRLEEEAPGDAVGVVDARPLGHVVREVDDLVADFPS